MSLLSRGLEYVGMGGGREKAPARPISPVNTTFKSITPMRNNRRFDGAVITTINLQSYAQAREVSNAFREGNNVIIEMSQCPSSDQAKMVNFMCGLKEGLEGNLERVTQSVFLLAHYGTSEGHDFDDSRESSNDGLVISPNF